MSAGIYVYQEASEDRLLEAGALGAESFLLLLPLSCQL